MNPAGWKLFAKVQRNNVQFLRGTTTCVNDVSDSCSDCDLGLLSDLKDRRSRMCMT